MFVAVTLGANTASDCVSVVRDIQNEEKQPADDIIPHVLVLSSPSSVLNFNVSFPSGFKWDKNTQKLSLSLVCLGGLFSLERNCTGLNSERHPTN